MPRRDDLSVRLDGLRHWLKAAYLAELDKGDVRVRFMDVDSDEAARLERTSPHLSQVRRVLRLLDSAAVVNVDHRRVKAYPPTEAVGWLQGYRGGVAVAADGTVAPSMPGVDVYP